MLASTHCSHPMPACHMAKPLESPCAVQSCRDAHASWCMCSDNAQWTTRRAGAEQSAQEPNCDEPTSLLPLSAGAYGYNAKNPSVPFLADHAAMQRHAVQFTLHTCTCDRACDGSFFARTLAACRLVYHLRDGALVARDMLSPLGVYHAIQLLLVFRTINRHSAYSVGLLAAPKSTAVITGLNGRAGRVGKKVFTKSRLPARGTHHTRFTRQLGASSG
jgi:hypothetical protein